jgi:hypothetical protein
LLEYANLHVEGIFIHIQKKRQRLFPTFPSMLENRNLDETSSAS